MPLRLFYFESDNAADAVQLATALVGRTTIEPPPAEPAKIVAAVTEPAALPAPAPRKVTRRKQAAAPVPGPPPATKRKGRAPAAGGPRDKAEAILRKAGKPMRKSEVARRIGCHASAMTAAARDPRFVVTPDGLLWLADQDDPRDEADESDNDEDDEPTETDEDPPPASASTKGNRFDPPTVAELKQAIKLCGPMDCAEFARFTGFSHATCHAALQSPEFERDTDGLYWLKKSGE